MHWTMVLLATTDVNIQVCPQKGVSCRLTYGIAEPDQPVHSCLAKLRKNETAQSSLKYPHKKSQFDSNQTLWPFLFDWQVHSKSIFLQKAAKAFAASASRYLTEAIIHTGTVIWTLFLPFFSFSGGLSFFLAQSSSQIPRVRVDSRSPSFVLSVQSDCTFQVCLPMTKLYWPTAKIKYLYVSRISCLWN